MTEIRTSVELRHPPERVWRALTDRELLPKWFASIAPRPSSISRFELRPVDLPELDELIVVELVEVDRPHRIVLRWPDEGQQTRLECELTPTAEGCRLTVVQGDDEEPWLPAEPGRRAECHRGLLDTRLPAVLDWLAFREVELPAPTQVLSAVPAGGPDPGRRSRRRLGAALAVLALAVGATVVATGLVLGQDDDRAGGPTATAASATPSTPAGTPAPSARTPTGAASTVPPSRPARPGSTPRRTSSPAAANPPRAGQPNLAARYSTVRSRLLGYEGEVVVTNDGDAAAPSWTLVLTLSGGARLADATGAESYRQEEQQVTFTGAPLAAKRSVTIWFEVDRDTTLTQKRPTSCAVGDQPCEGL
ncbi:SRPBCC domain-containing protein [Micromonospora sp. WMMD1102]|uniref:SRPBCC domain-containing protein n=1 Tax=Micromonospora sp. WMMD1102 TaxID=3016105 RepID=UPI0024157ED5|nr:SRPBCC domain-containing protein [Micromonospora sp. WMMD1102]MDG4786998.1 SRPBCC domain-containing protein [Micromonospora sp. WMMD1102]